MATLKYSEWRSTILGVAGHPFKSVKDLAKVNLVDLNDAYEKNPDLATEEYQSYKDKLDKQIWEESKKASKPIEQQPQPQEEPLIVELTRPERPPLPPISIEEDDKEVAELVELAATGKIKLPNVTHVPGRTYPELKKVKQEKKSVTEQTTTKDKPKLETTVLTTEGGWLGLGLGLSFPDMAVGFAIGCAASLLIQVIRTAA